MALYTLGLNHQTAPLDVREQVVFAPDAIGHALRDLDSTNGTTVNGAPFTGDAPLADGDVIDAGGCRIEYRSRP